LDYTIRLCAALCATEPELCYFARFRPMQS
jgi:hypothetical protein